MKGRLAMLVAVLAAVLIAGTGCGGSKKSSDNASETTTTTTTTSTTTTTTSSDDSSSSSSSSSSDSSGSSSDSSGSSSSSGSVSDADAARCAEKYSGLASKVSQAFASSSTGAPDGDKLRDYFNALADEAPSDIKSAFRTFADAYGKFFDAIKSVNVKAGEQPSAEDLAKMQTAVKEFDKADVKAATEKINAWVAGGCK